MASSSPSTLSYWVKERERIRLLKESGSPPPWTDDPILQSFRFCNVRREDDKVTSWIRRNWREPYADHPNLWLAMALSRQINLPETLEEIGFPETWNPSKVAKIMKARKERGELVYNSAYMIHACSSVLSPYYEKPKSNYITEVVIGNLWKDRKKVLKSFTTLQNTAETVCEYESWGMFMAGQVVADLKYTRYLKDAPDWMDWAALGPGSRRGLNRLAGRDLKHPLSQEDGLKEMLKVRDKLKLGLHLQDLQNCLCEFDKYERVRLGEGRPKQLYRGGTA